MDPSMRKKGISLIALSILTCVYSLVVRGSKVDGSYQYIPETIPFLSECTKAVIAGYYFFTESSLPLDERLAKNGFNRSTYLKFSIPAILYLISNNLVFPALTYLEPPQYQLLANLKIVTTAIMFRIILAKPLSQYQWIAVGLLVLGTSVEKLLDTSSEADVDAAPSTLNYSMGFFIMVIIAMLSALAGVSTEYLLKRPGATANQSLHFQNLQLYSFGIVANGLNALYHAWPQLSTLGFFHGFDSMTVMVVLTHAFMGLAVSFVMKYADNIVKLYSGAVSTILSSLASAFLFDYPLSFPLFVGVGVVMVSMYMYTAYPPVKPDYKKVSTSEV